MSDGIVPSVLKFLGRPNKAVLNLLTGNFEGAARQGLSGAFDAVDALLPGDWLPDVTREQDSPEFSDVIGGMEDGWGKTATDILGGIATDPLTYLGPGIFIKGAKLGLGAAVKGASKVAPELTAQGLKGAKNLGHEVRAATGNLRNSDEVKSLLGEAGGKSSATSKAAQGYAVPAFQGVAPDVGDKAALLLNDIAKDAEGIHKTLGIRGADVFGTVEEQASLIDQRLAKLPWDDATKQQVRDVAIKGTDYTRTMWGQNVGDNVFQHPEMLGKEMAPLDYIPRRTDMDAAAKEFQATGGVANPLKARTRTPEDLATALNNGEKLDTNIAKLLGDYGAQMGRAAESAAIGKKLAPEAFKSLADPASRAAVKEVIVKLREAGNLDDALALEVGFEGLKPREGFFKLMAGLNSIFKPAATGGAFIPKPGFSVRNAFSGAMQIGMDDGLGAGFSALSRTPKVLAGGFADGLRELGVAIPENARLAQIDSAIAASGGSRQKMLESISDKVIRQAVETGVIDHGFVSSEKMAETLAKAGPKNWKTWRDMPSHIVQGIEQRMRLGRFEELLKTKSAADAAKITSDNLYDYAYSSVMNRKIRDIIPFAQYPFKAIPQSAKFLTSGTPLANATLSGMSQLSNATGDNQVYPWMEGRLNIPLGGNGQGDNNFISGLGLPVESLAQIPNLSGSPRSIGRELERNIVASTQPVLKTGYGLISGHDPFSQQPTMAYDKIPIIGPAGDVGRAYNLAAGTGLLQPLDSPIRTVDKLLDSRRDLPTRLLDVGTGANVVSVDPNRAQQMQISQELEQNPQVSQYRSFYQNGEQDPEIKAKLDAMKAAGKAARAAAKPAVEPASPKRMFKAKANAGKDGLAESFMSDGRAFKVVRNMDGGISHLVGPDGERMKPQRDGNGRITGLVRDTPASPF